MHPTPGASLLQRAALEHEAWLAGERGVSRNTVAAYRRDLTTWIAHLAGRGRTAPGDVSEEDVTSYLEALRTGGAEAGPEAGRGTGLSPATVNRRIAAIRSFHRFCVREGLAASDPVQYVRAGNLPAT